MGILNRRNAVLGWAAWQVGKAAAKRKAKTSVKSDDRRPGKGAIVGAKGKSAIPLWRWASAKNMDRALQLCGQRRPHGRAAGSDTAILASRRRTTGRKTGARARYQALPSR